MPVSLITSDEEDALPEDDDATAFVMKERICRDEMNRLLSKYGQNDDDSEVWMEYVIQVRAGAIAYGVEDSLLQMPSKIDREAFWRFYEGSVTLASTLSRQAKRSRLENLVTLTDGEKARLEKRLAELRAAVDSSTLSNKIKANLRKRLDSFSDELQKEQSNLSRIIVAASLVFSAVSGAATVGLAGIEKAEDVIIKLPGTLEAISKIIGNAKTQEIERTPEQKSLPTPPKALRHQPKVELAEGYGSREAFSADLDDEIPF